MVLSWKRVECPFWVGEELLPQMEKFKCLGVLFTSEERMEREIRESLTTLTLYWPVVVKYKPSQKAKIYRLIYFPTFTYSHELWVVTERTRLRIQAVEMSFLCWVVGFSLTGRVRSSAIWEWLREEPLQRHIERSQLRWFGIWSGCLPDTSLVRRSGNVQPEGNPGQTQEGLHLSAGLGILWNPPGGTRRGG